MTGLIQLKSQYKLDQEYRRIDKLAQKLGITTESAIEYLLDKSRREGQFKARK
jgi:macrodomain Ter protein organizer (MatP/YcbG family)